MEYLRQELYELVLIWEEPRRCLKCQEKDFLLR